MSNYSVLVAVYIVDTLHVIPNHMAKQRLSRQANMKCKYYVKKFDLQGGPKSKPLPLNRIKHYQ